MDLFGWADQEDVAAAEVAGGEDSVCEGADGAVAAGLIGEEAVAFLLL